MMADNYLEAELVTPEGEIIYTTAAEAPNIVNNADYQFEPKIPYFCTKLRIKLHEVENDETVIYMPFKDLSQALSVMNQISKKTSASAWGWSQLTALNHF